MSLWCTHDRIVIEAHGSIKQLTLVVTVDTNENLTEHLLVEGKSETNNWPRHILIGISNQNPDMTLHLLPVVRMYRTALVHYKLACT